MTRPIEQNQANWVTKKDASALSGRDQRTIERWVVSGHVRTYREPGGRLLLYAPDFLPPTSLPARTRAS